jgi:hypothetical protein
VDICGIIKIYHGVCAYMFVVPCIEIMKKT